MLWEATRAGAGSPSPRAWAWRLTGGCLRARLHHDVRQPGTGRAL